ncbi:MAG TPA: sulfite exporter TauE/SafE family protein [Pirellulales bacterium]|nr:sulfite exporter TauE/SafE family protein [Pirellulales bacterium]
MEPLLIFFGGLLGSSHCVGMCGGFALAIGSGTRSLRANLVRQLVYGFGRIFTYSAGGGAVGYGGWRLARDLPPVVHAQAALCLVAGALMLFQGLKSAGVLGRLLPVKHRGACLTPGLFAGILSARTELHVFLAGMLNGLLPCGLVYAYLALATSTGNMLTGLTQMAMFGLGTVPIMVLTGCGASLLSLAGRRRLLRMAAWCVVLTGALSIARGYEFLVAPVGSCPGCH